MSGAQQSPQGTVAFAGHELDLETLELRRGGALVPMRPQVATVLELLVRSHPRLVTRGELREALWSSTCVEWEAGLHQLVRQLRRALGDDSRDPRFIETVPRRGYRFVGAVNAVKPPKARLGSGWRYAAAWLGGGVSVPAVVILVCAFLAR